MRRAFLIAVAIIAAILLVLLLVNVVRAQEGVCADRKSLVERLAERFGEARQAVGLSDDGSVIELFASAETGTWTITKTLPSGPTCMVQAGRAYEAVAEKLVKGMAG